MSKVGKNKVAVAVALAALVLVTLAAGSGQLAGVERLPRPVELFLWCLAATLAAAHRPFGGAGLGLGTLALPPVIGGYGAVTAALVAGTARLAATVFGLAADRRGRSDGGTLGSLATAGSVALAAFAGGVLETSDMLGAAAFGWRGLASAAVYVLVLALIVTLDRRVNERLGRPLERFAGGVNPLALGLDAGGWVLGALLAGLAADLGWGRVAPIVLAVVLLAAEAARNAIARGASDHRVGDLQRLHLAHERILGETSGMAAVADQVLVECSNILPVYWYQFETDGSEADGEEAGSWTAGPDGVLAVGHPRPAERPPMLPGVHRRAPWRVLDQPLEVDGEILARVRLWCDPRQVESGAEDLFATLVPQMASSVHRARLDREARLDPLTGVPVRRILESSLQQAFRRSCDEGRSMAVIMCDVDHFKRVNDTYGHAAGDQALIAVARALDAQRRENDLCCRYGGEEFTLLLEDASGDAALRLAERLRLAVAEIDLVFEGRGIPLALSAGVAAFPELHIKTASELLLLADEALYEAKRSGRNRCLLNLGQGAFRSVAGTDLGRRSEPAQRAPRIFS